MINYVQQTSLSPYGSGANQTPPFPSPNTAGNLIILTMLVTIPSTFVSVTDLANNNYVSAGPSYAAFNSNQSAVAFLYASNIKAYTANQITATYTSSAVFILAAFEFSGVATKGRIIDQVTANTGSSASPNSGPIIPSIGNELIFAMSSSAGAGYTATQNGFTNIFVDSVDVFACAYLVQVPASPVSSLFQFSNGSWGANISSFFPTQLVQGYGGTIVTESHWLGGDD